MGIYRQKYLKLTVKRRTDNKPLDWYFDLNEQADAAVKMCQENMAFIESYSSNWQKEGPPADDFVSDADEFKNWLFDLEA